MSFEPREFLRHILAEADYPIEQSRNLDTRAGRSRILSLAVPTTIVRRAS